MTIDPNEFEQLGNFVYAFQGLEREMEDLIILMVGGDQQMIETLVSVQSFSNKLNCLAVIFSTFVEKGEYSILEVDDFLLLLRKVQSLSERRNFIIHSRYWSYLDLDESVGFKLAKKGPRRKTGKLETKEEVIMPEDFYEDLGAINSTHQRLNFYTQAVRHCLDPDSFPPINPSSPTP